MSLPIIERYISLRHRLKETSNKNCEEMCEQIILLKCINMRPKTEFSLTMNLPCLMYDKQ